MKLQKDLDWKRLSSGGYCLALGPSRLDLDDLAEISALLEAFDARPPDIYAGPRGDNPTDRVDLQELAELPASRRQDITMHSASRLIAVCLWADDTSIVVPVWTSAAGRYARGIDVVIQRRLLLRRIILSPLFAADVFHRQGSWVMLAILVGGRLQRRGERCGSMVEARASTARLLCDLPRDDRDQDRKVPLLQRPRVRLDGVRHPSSAGSAQPARCG